MKRKPKRPFDHFKETRFGFEWGNMNVLRCISGEKFGHVIEVQGRDKSIVIRTTPSGRLRVEEQGS